MERLFEDERWRHRRSEAVRADRFKVSSVGDAVSRWRGKTRGELSLGPLPRARRLCVRPADVSLQVARKLPIWRFEPCQNTGTQPGTPDSQNPATSPARSGTPPSSSGRPTTM